MSMLREPLDVSSRVHARNGFGESESRLVASRLQSHTDHNSTRESLRCAVDCLLSLQKADGHWCGELQGDPIPESEYIVLMAVLGRDQEERIGTAGRYILAQQRPDGAWSNY